MSGLVTAGILGALAALMGVVSLDWTPVQAVGMWAASGPAGVIALLVASVSLQASLADPRA